MAPFQCTAQGQENRAKFTTSSKVSLGLIITPTFALDEIDSEDHSAELCSRSQKQQSVDFASDAFPKLPTPTHYGLVSHATATPKTAKILRLVPPTKSARKPTKTPEAKPPISAVKDTAESPIASSKESGPETEPALSSITAQAPASPVDSVVSQLVPHISSPSPPPTPPSPPSISIRVSHHAKHVFHTIMYDSEAHKQSRGGIAWHDFRKAMASAGFASNKHGGSKWSFHPPPSIDGGKIEIHEPHPKPFIEFWECRRIGRRLHIKYGLTAASFVDGLEEDGALEADI